MSDESSAPATNGEVAPKPVVETSPTASEQERPAVKPPLSSEAEQKMDTSAEPETAAESERKEEASDLVSTDKTETEEMADTTPTVPAPVDTAPKEATPEKEEVPAEQPESTEEKTEEKPDIVAPSESDAKDESPEPEPAPEPEQTEPEPKPPATKTPSPKKESPRKKAEKSPQKEARTPRTPKETRESPEKEDSDGKTPILEQPLVVPEGRKRNRKSVERWKTETTVTVKEFNIPEGSGTKLGEIEFIEGMISKTSAEDLKILHRLCFGSVGKSTMVKKHLRQFCGYDFTEDSDDGKKKLKSLEGSEGAQSLDYFRMQQKQLKQVCEILGLEKSKAKEEIVKNICSFLVSPTDNGKKAPQAKRGKKRSGSSKGRGRKGAKKSASEAGSEGSDDNSDNNSGAEKEEEEDEEPAPKKSKESNGKGRGRPKKDAGSKGPSDTELKTAIKKLLKGINLDTVTMKEMCKKVYDNFPDTDLTSRKDFIKSSVKAIISSSD